MVTATEPTKAVFSPATGKPKPATAKGDQRIVIRGLSWDLYDRLSDTVGERQHVYLAYDGKDLELMTKGWDHEDYKESFSRFVMIVTSELKSPVTRGRRDDLEAPGIERGLEADQCYYFTPKKLEVVTEARARKAKDIADIPNPDLAIEIDISPSQVDRPGIYAALNVAEVWRFDGESVVIEQLRPDGTYAPADTSLFLPVRAEEVCRWVAQEDSSDELAWEIACEHGHGRCWRRADLMITAFTLTRNSGRDNCDDRPRAFLAFAPGRIGRDAIDRRGGITDLACPGASAVSRQGAGRRHPCAAPGPATNGPRLLFAPAPGQAFPAGALARADAGHHACVPLVGGSHCIGRGCVSPLPAAGARGFRGNRPGPGRRGPAAGAR